MRVEYIDHSGNDLLVVNAARCSFGKEKYELDDKDEKLIHYLAREKHVLPFRHPQITFRCKAPIYLARQLGKHQVGLSWSEESRRYIDSTPEFSWPTSWRCRADSVKQGSDGDHPEQAMFDEVMRRAAEEALDTYEWALAEGLAPEQARIILPQNMSVTWVWTGSLLSYVHLIKLRKEGHAQVEAQQFATLVEELVKSLFPISYEALMAYD